MKKAISSQENPSASYSLLSNRLKTAQNKSVTACLEEKRQFLRKRPSPLKALIDVLTQKSENEANNLDVLCGHFNPEAAKIMGTQKSDFPN
ncbi:MAG: hypothetical protein ABF461_00885 [Zymomonas mobilis subsp. pomaceae]|uniref:hypothetical protein n=1 Tax=Zymomonas mobilis TaxID=542 RepID=UPI0006740E7A|nr:hypothetical protein [Zymomonas mobilis]MDX5948750.1 hypothetical protein [Zymomonas mobilis subsp. pomaceae]